MAPLVPSAEVHAGVCVCECVCVYVYVCVCQVIVGEVMVVVVDNSCVAVQQLPAPRGSTPPQPPSPPAPTTRPHLPQQPTRCRVQSRGGLIQVQHRRRPHLAGARRGRRREKGKHRVNDGGR